ncbi:hypothetical protein [Paenibacillus campi]|uniref:hypothetical protein n=1 Tax=Paenibacillus campi TaxID=3106031 RepID=UPI002AFF1234|nr:hypothetical protein [Paenibacillus sp. SGZ-1009]
MIDFLLGHLYIIVIIAFAIFTAISSRSGKNKARNRRQGMPTFGGGPDVPGRRPLTPSQTAQQREDEAQRRYNEAQRQFDRQPMDRDMGQGSSRVPLSQEGTSGSEGSYTDADTFEGSRMEATTETGRTAEQYRNEIQQRLDQLSYGMNERLDRMDLSSVQSPSTTDTTDNASVASGGLRLDPAQATQGVLWAEILSPPRSRHAGSFGRKAASAQRSEQRPNEA